MNWKMPEHSKSQVVKAGKTIKNPSATADACRIALKVIDNWRASHAFPLQIFYCNLSRKYKNTEYIIAQRLKRLNSIVAKLEREPTMSLWTMHDLGGCRVIVPTINEIYFVINQLKESRIRHILRREYDYISTPKPSGYRSYHMVYEYRSDKKTIYNRNMLIEIQIRTRLQHLWATAVEAMGLLTHQSLKSSQGETLVLRFFELCSSILAMLENTPIVPTATPTDKTAILAEIKEIDAKSHLLHMLRACKVAVENLNAKVRPRKGYYILILNYDTRRLSFKYYQTRQVEKANADYNSIENQAADNIDAVLVSVDSFTTLKAAYPNYFSDIEEFVSIIEHELLTLS